MSHAVLDAAALVGVGVVAGTVNVIAGGGSFLTLPLMIFLGLPPTVANGTNRLAIITQNAGAVWSFQRKGLIERSWVLISVPPAVVGAVLGTLTAVRIGDLAFQRILALCMVAITAWTLWRPVGPRGSGGSDPPRGVGRMMFVAAYFAAGFYGGFIQAGVGFVVLAITTAGGLDLVRGNAIKVTLALLFTPLALALFAASGKVDWLMAVWLAVGTWLGGLAGVHLQVLKGHAWVRNVVTVTIVVFAVKLLLGE